MLCELCGAEVARARPMIIEGTVLNVCSDCSRFGVEATRAPSARRRSASGHVAQGLEQRARRMTPKDVYADAGEEELVIDLAQRVRRAREAHGWKQADLGAKINERVSVIAKLEAGAMHPDDALARKLERALGVQLKEKTPTAVVRKETPRGAVTLGDLVNLED